MKTPVRLVMFLLLFISGLRLDAQTTRLPLDKTIFKNEIRERGWSLEDTTKKKSLAEFLILSFARDTLAVAYFNLLEGAAGSYSRYDCAYNNNFMEVKALNWQPIDDFSDDSVKVSDMPPMQYLYAYRKSKTELAVLFSRSRKKMNDALLREKDWLVFTMVKE